MKITEEMLSDMVATVGRLDGRMSAIEKSVSGLGRGRNEDQEILRKALLSGHNPNSKLAVVGWDGASEAQLLTMSSKTKCLGKDAKGNDFGEFLHTVAASNAPAHWGIGMPRERVEKVLKTFGSRVIQKAPNAEGSGATGGFLVPPQYYAKLLEFVAEDSFVKSLCTTLPMTGLNLMFPYLNQSATTASATSNYPSSNFFGGVFASWSPENSTSGQANPVFKQGTLTAKTLLILTISSLQLIQDSFTSIDALITTLLTKAIAWSLDYAALRGDGVLGPLGVINAPGTISATRTGGGSTFTLASASAMLERVVISENFNNLVWVMHQSLIPQLVQMVNNTASNSQLVFYTAYGDGVTSRMPMKLFGIPIYFTEKVPKLGTAGDVMLLDMTKYLYGDRMNIQIESTPIPGFANYQMYWRAVARVDGQPMFDAPITLADGSGAFTVSPHVILAT